MIYVLKKQFIGKMVSDSRGKHYLTAKTTQKELKDLYILGHEEKIDILPNEEKKQNTSHFKSNTNKGKSRYKKQTD